MRIYVCHAYGRRRGLSMEALQRNVNASIRIGLEIIKKGHNPFIPNLYHYVHLMSNGTIDEGIFFRLVSEWVRFSEALFVGSEPSDSQGVQAEIDMAKEIGIPIYYDIKEVPEV